MYCPGINPGFPHWEACNTVFQLWYGRKCVLTLLCVTKRLIQASYLEWVLDVFCFSVWITRHKCLRTNCAGKWEVYNVWYRKINRTRTLTTYPCRLVSLQWNSWRHGSDSLPSACYDCRTEISESRNLYRYHPENLISLRCNNWHYSAAGLLLCWYNGSVKWKIHY
jgi:hypothetical protein